MHQCNPVLHQCNRFFVHMRKKHLLHPLLPTLGNCEVSDPCRFSLSGSQGKKTVYTNTAETLLFFHFRILRPLWCIPSLRTFGVYHFPLFSRGDGIHPSLFCSVTSGSGNRPREEGCHGGGVCSLPLRFELFSNSLDPCGWRAVGESFLLGPLSRKLLWIFSSNLPGNFALKNARDFWSIFSGLRFPRNEARKFGENSVKFGAKFGTRIQRIRGTFVLQLF